MENHGFESDTPSTPKNPESDEDISEINPSEGIKASTGVRSITQRKSNVSKIDKPEGIQASKCDKTKAAGSVERERDASYTIKIKENEVNKYIIPEVIIDREPKIDVEDESSNNKYPETTSNERCDKHVAGPKDTITYNKDTINAVKNTDNGYVVGSELKEKNESQFSKADKEMECVTDNTIGATATNEVVLDPNYFLSGMFLWLPYVWYDLYVRNNFDLNGIKIDRDMTYNIKLLNKIRLL
jgi:hypothetical protein